jgi:hypothetical protein
MLTVDCLMGGREFAKTRRGFFGDWFQKMELSNQFKCFFGWI